MIRRILNFAIPEQFKKLLDWWQRERPWYVADQRLMTNEHIPTVKIGSFLLRREKQGGDEPLRLTYVDDDAIQLNVWGEISMTMDQVLRLIMDLHHAKEIIMDADNEAGGLTVINLEQSPTDIARVELMTDKDNAVIESNVVQSGA